MLGFHHLAAKNSLSLARRYLEFFARSTSTIVRREGPTTRTRLGANMVMYPGEVETQRSDVGAEEVLETRAELHEVKQVAESFLLAETALRRLDVIVYLGRDKQI